MNILKKNILLTVLILTPLVLSISLSMDIYVPSLPAIIQQLHTSQQTLQWTLSLYMFGVGLGQLCVGPLTDHLGRRKIVQTGLCLYLLGTLACLLAPSIALLIAGRLLQSIGTCAALVVAFAVVRDLYDSRTSAKIYSFLNATTALGPVVAPLLGGYLQEAFGTWRASFFFLLIFGGISFLTTYYFLQETLPIEKRVMIEPKELRKRYKKILTLDIFTTNAYHSAVGLTVLFIFCCISPYLLIQDLQISQMHYGFCFASNAITFILANLISTRVSYYFDLHFPIKIGIATIFIGAATMLIVSLIGGLTLWNFLAPMWIMTLGAGLMMGPAVALALEHFPEIAGTASSVVNAIQFIVSGIFGTLLMMHNAASVVPFSILLMTLALLSLVMIKASHATAHLKQPLSD